RIYQLISSVIHLFTTMHRTTRLFFSPYHNRSLNRSVHWHEEGSSVLLSTENNVVPELLTLVYSRLWQLSTVGEHGRPLQRPISSVTHCRFDSAVRHLTRLIHYNNSWICSFHLFSLSSAGVYFWSSDSVGNICI